MPKYTVVVWKVSAHYKATVTAGSEQEAIRVAVERAKSGKLKARKVCEFDGGVTGIPDAQNILRAGPPSSLVHGHSELAIEPLDDLKDWKSRNAIRYKSTAEKLIKGIHKAERSTRKSKGMKIGTPSTYLSSAHTALEKAVAKWSPGERIISIDSARRVLLNAPGFVFGKGRTADDLLDELEKKELISHVYGDPYGPPSLYIFRFHKENRRKP